MKYVELKTTEYKVFEIEDDVTYEDVAGMYETGELLMDCPDTFFLDAQIVGDKSEFDGTYEDITDL